MNQIQLSPEEIARLEEKRAIASQLPERPEIDLVGKWLWLHFENGKPSDDSRGKLKAAGFFFAAKKKKWIFSGQRIRRQATRLTYRQICDLHGASRLAQGVNSQEESEGN